MNRKVLSLMIVALLLSNFGISASGKNKNESPLKVLLSAAALYAVPTAAMATASYFANNRTMSEEQLTRVLHDGAIPLVSFIPGFVLGSFCGGLEDGEPVVGNAITNIFGWGPAIITAIAGVAHHATNSIENIQRLEQIHKNYWKELNKVYEK